MVLNRLRRTGWRVVAMNGERARAVQRWRYVPPYDFYNGQDSAEAFQELIGGDYLALAGPEGVTAFVCTGYPARIPHYRYIEEDRTIDLGLGVRPDLTGRGGGRAFVNDVLELLPTLPTSPPEMRVRLTVADFNRRAIRVYQGVGFQECGAFLWSRQRWVVMMRDI